MGYVGHLWSHGISYSEAERDLDLVMKGEQDWVAAARRLKITHIFWGPAERARYGVLEPEWKKSLSLIGQVGDQMVYEFKEIL